MKRFVRTLLCLVLVISMFPSVVFAGFDGGTAGDGGGQFGGGTVTVGGTPGPKQGDGLKFTTWDGRGTYGVRIRAFPGSPVKGSSGSLDYFTYTADQKIFQLPYGELVNAKDYATTDKWKYFVGQDGRAYNPDGRTFDTWQGFTIYQYFGPGNIGMTTGWKRASDEYKKFISLCNPNESVPIGSTSKVLTNAAYLDSLLHSDYLKDLEHRVALGEYLGLTHEEAKDGNFYIITEQIVHGTLYYISDGKLNYGLTGQPKVEFVMSDGRVVPSGEFALTESRATYEAVDPSKSTTGVASLMFSGEREMFGVKIAEGTYSTMTSYYQKVTNATWKQTEAPWSSSGYTMGSPLTDGYTIYGIGDLSTSKVGGNIAVEYDGDVNTSDPSKFKSTGSLLGDGGTTSLAYFDFVQSKFVDSDDQATLLKFAGKIDMSDKYALCFTGVSNHSISDNTKLEQVLQDSFENAPGNGYTSNSLTWGSPFATGGEYNVGHVWKVTALDGYTSVVPIINRFQNAFNAASTGGALAIGSSSDDTTSKYSQYSVLEGSWLNAEDGRKLSSEDVLEKGTDGKYTLKKDEQLGMGYEFIIRGTPVISREITILVDGDEDGNVDTVSSSQTWEEEYTTAKNVIHPVEEVPDYTFVGWLVVPYQDDDVTTAIENSLKASTCDIDSLFGAAKSAAPTMVESSGATATIGIGSTREDEPPEGYTVYKIAYKGPPVPQPPGEVILPAYMLNRYFNNIIQTSSQLSGSPQKYTLARDWTWVAWNSWVQCHCRTHKEAPNGFKRDWVHEYRDIASSEEFGLDNAMIDRYYPKGTGTWSGAQRSKLYGHGWTQPMNTEGMSESAYVVDYAFNLVRANTAFGDKRAMSGISYQSYQQATGDSSDMLRISSDFGVTPKTIKKAALARNSLAVLKTYQETFNIESRFQYDASPIGNHVKSMVSGSCSHRHGSDDYTWYCRSTWSYYPGIEPHLINGFRSINGSYSDKITYTFNASAMKYTTKDDLGAGKNDFLGGSTSKPLTAGRRNSAEGSITPSNFYRFTTVRYTSVDLKFHPENLMVFKIGGTDFAQINSQPYVTGYTMSEVKRTSKSSGMYFFRLNADITSLPGTVYSDSMQGGTGTLGFGSTVSIPAGADVTIAADPSGVDIDLYGYTLDLVQTEDDGKIGAVGNGRAYNTVVRSGLNAYNEWGNSNSHEKLLKHFNEWCDNMLKVENFAADFQLYVGSGTTELKSENFSATIGRVERGTAGTVEDGIYQLVVEKGILQTSKGDYNALISQIATDYGCSNAEATAMFKESAMYTAIINGMETCKNDKNNSKDVLNGLSYTPDILASWTDTLGGDGNWYDETSRTFVVRRFTNLGNKLCDVIATDKIDYQLAPTGSSRPGENASSALSYNAWWHLNIFFDQNAKDKVNDLLLGSSTYYDPQNGSTNFNPANNAFSVMFNSIPVANADFKIPASSTQDFYN